MKIPSETDMRDLVDHWRSLMPQRPLTYGEHLESAREQAYHVRAFADTDHPDMNLIWLTEQTAIPVTWVPSHVLNRRSGLTTDLPDGILKIFINKNEPLQRQRFSVVHELKHALDFYKSDLLYDSLGSGDEEKRYQQIEAIANEFAAEVLMPAAQVQVLWQKTPDLALLADLFNVTTEAMQKRLEKLGFIGQEKPRPRKYFRNPGPIRRDQLPRLAYAA